MAKPNESYTEEEQKRINAVNRYQMGERPSKICESVGRSRAWLRKWIGRYDNSDKSSKKEWFRDESKAPKNVYRKTDSELEQLIINVRKSFWIDTTTAMIGNVRRLTGKLYRGAEFRRILRSIRITCRSQRAKCTSYDK